LARGDFQPPPEIQFGFFQIHTASWKMGRVVPTLASQFWLQIEIFTLVPKSGIPKIA